MAEEQLLFRRQYIAGPRYIDTLPGWQKIAISDEWVVTAHPDLEVTQVCKEELQLTLLGFFIDPYHPEHNNQEVLEHLGKRAHTFTDIAALTENLGGRWVLICKEGESVKIFHDMCGLRQIFYTIHMQEQWFSSQPSLLLEFVEHSFPLDQWSMSFMNSPQFEYTERSWPGDATPYQHIKHLLPNHYLDLQERKVVRYWPTKSLPVMRIDEVVEEAAVILKGLLEGAARRYSLMLPVSAGWDSRTLLAASKAIKEEMFFYVSKHGRLTDESPDIDVPRRLFPRLGLPFHVLDCRETMDESFKQLFERNVTLARNIPKALTIYHHFKYSQGMVNVCGNGSEIARKCVYTYYDVKTITPKFLAKISFYKNNEFAIYQYDRWLQEVKHYPEEYRINLLDLHYWEQRMGNWGAMYPAEQDIAVEEFSPFNHKRLITVLMSVDEKYRRPPHYLLYHELIRKLWGDVLIEPINPQPIIKAIKGSLRQKLVPYLL